VLDMLDTAAVSYQIVLTKSDEPKKGELAAVIEKTQTAIAKRPAAYPEIMVTSSREKAGVVELRAAIAQLLHERGETIPQ